MGERCRDEQTLRDYGVCEPWIVQVRQRLKHAMLVPNSGHRFTWPQLQLSNPKDLAHAHCPRLIQQLMSCSQVAGFTVNPEQPGKRLEKGVLVPCEG